MKQAKRIPAAAYIRMSTEMQTDSPDRQRGEIEAMADRDGYQIIHWYEDHGLTGTESKNRPQFQELMKAARRQEFRAVLMYELSRFSREDVFDAMVHWKELKDAGVKLVTCQRGEVQFNDLAGLITAIIGQHEARGESMKLAMRTLSGRKMQASNGVFAARAPFGFDRLILNESGQEIKRISCREKFRKPKTWTSKLVPSDDHASVEAVKYAFKSVAEGRSLRSVAIELNRRGLRTSAEVPFDGMAISRMVQNPAYVGTLRFGKESKGKFATCGDDIIVVPNAHQALVSHSLFDMVKAIRNNQVRPSRGARPGCYLLSGLVFCGHCGAKMTGHVARGKYQDPDGYKEYVCRHLDNGEKYCPVHPSISGDAMEHCVLRFAAHHVLVDENLSMVMQEAEEALRRGEQPSPEEMLIDELQAKIKRGERNLALVDGANFQAIAAQLDKWREQLKRLKGTRKPQQAVPLNEAMKALSRITGLGQLRDNIFSLDHTSTKLALHQCVKRIEVRKELFGDEKNKLYLPNGFVEFRSEVFAGAPIPFGDAELYPDRACTKVAAYVKKARRAVRSIELGKALGMSSSNALQHAKRAVILGLCVMRRGPNGWEFEAKA